jgi:hypothetical protein
LTTEAVTIYSYNMAKHKKLLEKAINNPRGLSYSHFETLLQQCGWSKDHQTGSHAIWYSPKKFRLSIQNRNGMAKEYQVKQFLSRYYEEEE